MESYDFDHRTIASGILATILCGSGIINSEINNDDYEDDDE